jgi:hypothetical protein
MQYISLAQFIIRIFASRIQRTLPERITWGKQGKHWVLPVTCYKVTVYRLHFTRLNKRAEAAYKQFTNYNRTKDYEADIIEWSKLEFLDRLFFLILRPKTTKVLSFVYRTMFY